MAAFLKSYRHSTGFPKQLNSTQNIDKEIRKKEKESLLINLNIAITNMGRYTSKSLPRVDEVTLLKKKTI